MEKGINELKTEIATLKNKISQLESMGADNKKKEEKIRKDTKRKNEIIRGNKTKIADLEKMNKILQNRIEKLKRMNDKTKTKKKDLVEENKKMVEQIRELKAEKEEPKLLQVQTDLEELNQLKTQNGDLSSQIEELNRKVKSSESECKRLKEELEKSYNFQSRKYI